MWDGIGRTRLRCTGWYYSICFFNGIHIDFPWEGESGGIARGYRDVSGTVLLQLSRGGTCTLRHSLGGEISQRSVGLIGDRLRGGQRTFHASGISPIPTSWSRHLMADKVLTCTIY